MSLLKNSSATETIGEFQKTSRDFIMSSVGPDLAAKMAGDLPSPDNFLFMGNKGDFTLRSMAALIDGNTINSLLFPTYRGVLGLIKEAVPETQNLLNARGYGTLRSDVFYF